MSTRKTNEHSGEAYETGSLCIGSNKKNVNHPSHYGGANNQYEAIKVIENWNLGFNLGNALKYISRAGKKDDIVQDLEKAAWYLSREITNLKKKSNGSVSSSKQRKSIKSKSNRKIQR